MTFQREIRRVIYNFKYFAYFYSN